MISMEIDGLLSLFSINAQLNHQTQLDFYRLPRCTVQRSFKADPLTNRVLNKTIKIIFYILKITKIKDKIIDNNSDEQNFPLRYFIFKIFCNSFIIYDIKYFFSMKNNQTIQGGQKFDPRRIILTKP
jgi:hypothetical protein